MTAVGLHTTTKKELVNRIADQTGHTKVVVKEILQTFLDEIIEELATGNRLEFREFGVFEVKERKARRAQNPRTLEKVEVPAKRVVKFKVGRMMRRRVCDTPTPEAPGAKGTSPQGGAMSGAGLATRSTDGTPERSKKTAAELDRGSQADSGVDPTLTPKKPPTNRSPF